MDNTNDRIRSLLTSIYGRAAAAGLHQRVVELIHQYRSPLRAAGMAEQEITERDSILITYGDQLSEAGRPPLRALAEFCDEHLAGLVSGIHLLPFYPYSSDDGFSVIDYRAVNPELGAWEDVARLGRNFRLMFDAVINHISAESEWFKAFLRGDPAYGDYFIVVEGEPDLSAVVRPRALPLLTKFETPSGIKAVWTTFSEDQIDLNYRNPEVLLEVIDTLLFYAAQGAEFIRLDAAAFMWKEIGTPCIHLPETHRLIQLFRAALDAAAPRALLITETNVPHADNVSYFGDGANEAQMVYNFALPPLALHTFRTGSARALSEWARGLTLPSPRTTFFNFLASHDGIGLNPARGILPPADIEALVRQTLDHGGLVSYKNDADGAHSPYELNINYFDALSNPAGGEPLEIQAERFMAAQAVMLALIGVPGIYFHSLFGSRGWPQGAASTGRNRTINRQKLKRADLERDLADENSLRHSVFRRYKQLLKARAASPAFHPHGGQRILDGGDSVFAVMRLAPAGGQAVLCLHNVSDRPQSAAVDLADVFGGGRALDLISGSKFAVNRRRRLRLNPYQSLWLQRE